MDTSSWDKFKLLTWKNWIIQWRHKKRTFFELLIPLLSTALLLLIRYALGKGKPEETIFFNGLESNVLHPLFTSPINAFAYSPENPELNKLVTNAAALIKYEYEAPKVLANQSSNDLERFLTNNDVLVGIQFPDSYKNLTNLPDNLEYSLRFPSKQRHSTSSSSPGWVLNKLFSDFSLSGPRNRNDDDGGYPPGYYSEGFIQVQSALSQAFITMKGGVTPSVHLQRYPYPHFVNDPFWMAMESFIPLIVILTLASPAMNLVKYITLEKEQQLKETMKIMGLPNWLHWTSWFLKGFIQFAITVTLMTIMFKVILQTRVHIHFAVF